MSRTKNRADVNRDGGSEPIELFSTAYGIRAVDSPVRVKIIAMLKDREMPFDEIVEGTGRAKSTVSVHLNDMIQEGIINSRLDTNDRRKKIFFINSSYLGGLQKDRILDDDLRELMSRQGIRNAIDFYKVMFRTIRVEMYQEGINIDPVLSEAGYRVGGALYTYIGSPDLEELLGNLASFWESHGLGRIVIKSHSPLTIFVYDCFECAELPLLGRPACAFDIGMLRSIFFAHYGEERAIDETECYAMGHDHCCFVIADHNR
jgi:predicted hydrocarbon binding protein